MTSGWITLLKNVPWGEVVGRAPALADGARKLWQHLRKKQTDAGDPADGAETETADGVEAQLLALQHEVTDLRQQLVASSELLNSLADQNAQLVQRVEALHRRQRWLSGGLAGLGVALVVALLYLGR